MYNARSGTSAKSLKVLLLAALGTLTGMGVALETRALPINVMVTDTVANIGIGQFLYEYTVHNTGSAGADSISAWEIPYFDDSSIANIMSPAGWSWNIEVIGVPNPLTGWAGVADWQAPGDPFYQGASSPYTTVTQVLHWYSEAWAATGFGGGDEINPGDSLGVFSFDASFDTTSAPYQAVWLFSPSTSGGPAGIPGSPMALGGSVPAPATIALLGLGLAGLGWSRRKKV